MTLATTQGEKRSAHYEPTPSRSMLHVILYWHFHKLIRDTPRYSTGLRLHLTRLAVPGKFLPHGP